MTTFAVAKPSIPTGARKIDHPVTNLILAITGPRQDSPVKKLTIWSHFSGRMVANRNRLGIPVTQTAVQPETKGKGALKREATEAEIINAFGRVVERNGLRNVGVNEVIKEAGIGKALLYRYFGGLPGLVQAWGEKNQIWPDLSELADMSNSMDSVSVAEQIKRMVLHHANSLREDPVRVELLADEFMSPTAISDALTEIRQQLGREHAAIFAGNRELDEDGNRALMIVLMAAASYLAMRAVRSPRYMGRDVGSDEGWQAMLAHFERIIDSVAGDASTADAPTDNS